MKYFVLLILSLGLILFFYSLERKTENVATSVIIKAETVTNSPAAKPFLVLLVPGHDTDSGGANFKDVYERDLAVAIANKIAEILNSDDYKVIVTRDTENWNPIFSDYFKNEEQTIIDFKNAKQAEDRLRLSSGQKIFVPDMAEHSEVDRKTAVVLYGINKWADENDVGLVIHLHFNDSERPDMNLAGTFKGFAIYMPEKQLINSASSSLVAQSVYVELSEVLTPEIVAGQNDSIFEDQSLIALGASGTLTKPALLIEYGYIYEKMFRTKEDREVATNKIAEKTSAGIKNYVNIMR